MARKHASQQYGTDWLLSPENEASNTWSHNAIQIILLQEIRDELKALNRLLNCRNFTGIPTTLRSIRRAMPVRRAKAKAKR